MTDLQKFYADAERIKKHERTGSSYDGIKTCKKIAEMFLHDNSRFGDLPKSMADYWLSEYIEKSPVPYDEPTENHLDKLAAMKSFMDNTGETDSLTEFDWEKIADFVNYEAVDLPIDSLSSMMSELLEKGIL